MEKIQIRQIRKKDLNQARKFAVDGMNLSQYISNKMELYLYSKYVLYLELSKSTITLGAYLGDQLVGFLFARFKGESPVFDNWGQKFYVRLAEKLIALSGHEEKANTYDQANKEMFTKFSAVQPDGEITFFAVDPELKGKRIGSFLLSELEHHQQGKQVYLYTDSMCNYPFYLKKGFEIFDDKDIVMPSGNRDIALTCYLMYKKL